MDKVSVPDLEKSLMALEESVRLSRPAPDLPALYRRLREEAPIYWSDHLGQWLVTSYDLVDEILRLPNRFSSDSDDSFVRRLPEAQRSCVPTLSGHYAQRGLIQTDPPEHTRLRRALSRPFGQKAIKGLEGAVRQAVASLLDDVADDLDVMRDLARPLPIHVIADLLGVPVADRDGFPRWSEHAARFFSGHVPDFSHAREFDADLVEWRALLLRLFDECRNSPRDGVLTHMAALIDQGTITEEEALVTSVTLLNAGHETTTSLIGSTVFCLLRHREQLADVLMRPELVPEAVEETLRFEPPITEARRRATEPCVIGGRAIDAGDIVTAVLAAANRDPDRFDHPDEFDVRRKASGADHVSFGRGVHHCLGAALARLETPIAVRAVLDRYPDAHLPVDLEPQWRSSLTMRALATLPISTRR